MKILTLWQPWATLIALGYKTKETRSWGTDYRELLAIHAAKRKVIPGELAKISYDSMGHLTWDEIKAIDYPLGQIVCVVELVGCKTMYQHPGVKITRSENDVFINEQAPLEIATGLWESGRFAWDLQNILKLSNPIPCKGGQGLRNLDPEIVQKIEAANGFSGVRL